MKFKPPLEEVKIGEQNFYVRLAFTVEPAMGALPCFTEVAPALSCVELAMWVLPCFTEVATTLSCVELAMRVLPGLNVRWYR